jgi:cell division protein FtsW
LKIAVTILVFCVTALLALGLVMLYSSGMGKVGAHYLMLQLVWCTVGLGVALATTLVDYHQLKKIWWMALGAAVLMLALVLLTNKVNGARRWFKIGSLSLQPSEFAKVALIIALAWYGEYFERQMPLWKRGILLPGLLIGLTVGLIFKEPDVGNALVLATVSGALLFIAGIRLWHILPPILVVILGVGMFIYHNPTRSDRIYSWLHPEETKLDIGNQAYEARIALGSGGLTGKGLGDGLQKLGFVPFHHTDFIFCIIGEELGLIATTLVTVAFIAIVFCGTYIAMNARDTFGLLLGAGITFLIGLQAFVNIGVVTSALPNKGLPLPFVSYGGSNMVVMLASVGLLLNIARQTREVDAGVRGLVKDRDPANPFARRAQPQS